MALTGALSLLAPALGSARAIAEEPVDGPSVDGPDGSDEGVVGPGTGASTPGDAGDGSVDGATRSATEAVPMVDGMACEADVGIAKVYARDGLRPQFGMLAIEKYARFVDGFARVIKDKDELDKAELEPWDVRLEATTPREVTPVIADLGVSKDAETFDYSTFLLVDSMPASLLLDEGLSGTATGGAVGDRLGLDVTSLAGSAPAGIASELSEPKPIDELDGWLGTETEFIDEVLHPWAVESLGLAPEDMTGYAVVILEDVRSGGEVPVGLDGLRLRIPVRSQDLSDTAFDDEFDAVYSEEGFIAEFGAELGEKKDSDPASSRGMSSGGAVGPSSEHAAPFPGRLRGTIIVDLEVIDPGVTLDGDEAEPYCVLAGVARFRPAGGGDGGSDDDATAGPVPTSVPSGEGPSDRLPGLVFGIGLTAAGAAAVRRRLAPRPETVAPVG